MGVFPTKHIYIPHYHSLPTVRLYSYFYFYSSKKSVTRITSGCCPLSPVYMDEDVLCNVVIHNDDMAHGDLYAVESDQWDGRSPHDRRPAECWTAFDFGVRFVAVTVKEWRCDEAYTEPFLAVYDNCAGDRLALLVCVVVTLSWW